MDKREDSFLKKLQLAFKTEAEEHIQAISSSLLDLEKIPSPEKQIVMIESIFREAHSLKGAARAVNMTDIETICQSLESLFASLKHNSMTLSPQLFDTLHHAVDVMSKLLSSPAEGSSAISELMQQLSRAQAGERESMIHTEDYLPLPPKDILPLPSEKHKHKGETKAKEKAPIPSTPEIHNHSFRDNQFAKEKPVLSETVRISTEKLDSLLLQTEEMLSIKLSGAQQNDDLRDITGMLNVWRKEWVKNYPQVRTFHTLLEKKDKESKHDQGNAQLGKLMEFFDRDYTHIESIGKRLTALATSSKHSHRLLSGMVDNLLDDMKKVLMLPFSTLLEIFPKMIRDLSRDQGKEVEVTILGSEVEIDRRILEEMKDPLIHLLRNCIDHGIEKPEERVKNKKLPRGIVTIVISQLDSNKIEICISDDGSGIDLEKVKKVAVKSGVISEKEAENLSEADVLSLIFQSDVSTSPIITDISGRGLGLAIVREKVGKLGGHISVQTKAGVGTVFRILLPLTIATFRGIIVQVEGQVFVIPTVNVERVMRIKREEIKTVENRETILLNDSTVSLVRLTDVLELPQIEKKGGDSKFIPVLVLGSTEKRIAFSVDKVLTEQEILVKSLGKNLSRIRHIAGATVLGSGKVVPILNVSDLMKSAVKVTSASTGTPVTAEMAGAKRKSILVVEDSITSRMLLKNILEASGYLVKTAVDGIEAWTALRMGDSDLVVSDVDMPRMNGFELTSKIRSDKKTAELPIILVTGLESREDRERGIDVGANAYIVKSSFDQSNLLEVIQRLI